jgi:cytochrome c556
MNKRLALFGLAAVLAAGTVAAVPSLAQAAASDIILTRQAGYDLLGSTFSGMKAAIDNKLDVKPLAGGADAMAKWGKTIPLAFPPGSDTGNPNKALPTVWSDSAGFQKAAANFTEAAEKLSVVAKTGDADAFAAQWKVVGGTCGACHKEYRAK